MSDGIDRDDVGGGAPARERTAPELETLEPSVARELPMSAERPDHWADDATGETAGAAGRESGWAEASPRPYFMACGVALAAMVLLVGTTALPGHEVFQIGLTFLAVAMGVRRLQDMPDDTRNPLLSWIRHRSERLTDQFGVEFYGIAGLTAFLRAEADWAGDLSIGDLLSDPIGTAVSWFVSGIIESIVNAIWASLWWVQLMRVIDGWPLFFTLVAAGWLVWRLLDITPRNEEE